MLKKPQKLLTLDPHSTTLAPIQDAYNTSLHLFHCGGPRRMCSSNTTMVMGYKNGLENVPQTCGETSCRNHSTNTLSHKNLSSDLFLQSTVFDTWQQRQRVSRKQDVIKYLTQIPITILRAIELNVLRKRFHTTVLQKWGNREKYKLWKWMRKEQLTRAKDLT